MKLFFLFIFTIFFNESLQAQITQDLCNEPYDYSDRFPSVRDQDGHGLCWSFAAASLYEEALCLTSRKNPEMNYNCGQKISVLDMARCEFALSSGFNEGGLSHTALECVLSKKGKYQQIKRINDVSAQVNFVDKEHLPGVCLESQAPFNNLRKGFAGIYDSIFRGLSGPLYFNNYLVKIYQECKDCIDTPDDRSKLNESVVVLQKLLKLQEENGVNIKEAIVSEPTSEDFLRNVLIPPNCKESRLDLSNQFAVKFHHLGGSILYSGTITNGKNETTKTIIPGPTTEKKFNILKKLLKNGTSVEAGICYGHYKPSRKASFLDKLLSGPDGPVSDEDCGGHAIILAGIRWNEKKQQCETFVRNSWGKNSSLSGWVKAENLLDVTNNFSQLVKK